MIGPASRHHFHKALAAAGRAESHIHPGALIIDVQRDLALAQIELVRGIAFAFMQDEVSVKPEAPDYGHFLAEVMKKLAQEEGNNDD